MPRGFPPALPFAATIRDSVRRVGEGVATNAESVFTECPDPTGIRTFVSLPEGTSGEGDELFEAEWRIRNG